MHQAKPQDVANTFVAILRDRLTEVEFAELCVRNATALPGVCHSHDFCDANEAMLESFHRHGVAALVDIGAGDDPQLQMAAKAATELWDQAWELAKPKLGGAQPTPAPAAKVKRLTDQEKEEAIEAALNAACLSIQKAIGQTDGGKAGIFFTGQNRELFDQLFGDYLKHEESFIEGDAVDTSDLVESLKGWGFDVASTGGSATALLKENATHYIMLTDATGMSAKIDRKETLLLGFYEIATGEEVAMREGRWIDLIKYVDEFIHLAKVPEAVSVTPGQKEGDQ